MAHQQFRTLCAGTYDERLTFIAALNRKAFFFLLPLSMLRPFLGGHCQTETRRGDRKEGTSVPSNVSAIVDVFLEDEALK